MSAAAEPTTRLQGCLYVPTAVTIRYTDDPTGVPTTSDFVVSAQSFYASHDDFIRAWQTRLTTDFGMLAPTIAVGSIAGGLGFVTVTTLGNNFSVDWSFSGDGTTIRAWLGFSGNIVNQASGYTDAPMPAAFYPTTAAQRISRSSTYRPRAHGMTLSGASRTQHVTSFGDSDAVNLDIELWCGTTNPHTAQRYFEEYFLDGLETYSYGQQFTLDHGGTTHFCAFPDAETRIRTERVDGGWDGLWRISFTVTANIYEGA